MSQTVSPLRVFRDLPGVEEARDMLIRDDQAGIDNISRHLFGIAETDTLRPVDWEGTEARWEEHFALLYTDDEELAIWALMGWDVSDGEGHEHDAMSAFGRQLVCVTRGLAGRMPPEDIGPLPRDEREQVVWEAELEREREAFVEQKRQQRDAAINHRFRPERFELKPRKGRR